MKIFILDTNVLLHDPQSIFSFQDNQVVIPISVIQELDNQKRRSDQIGLNAREVSRQLDELRKKGNLSSGIKLPNGGLLRIELNHNIKDENFPFDLKSVDNRILNLASHLKNNSDNDVILVTKDLNLRIMADSINIKSEDFYNDKIDSKNLYTGVTNLYLNSKYIDILYFKGILSYDEIDDLSKEELSKENFFSNQFCIFSEENKKSCLARFFNNCFYRLRYGDDEVCGIKALNKEQKFALELLMDDDIPLVTLLGKAGSGKTLLALAAAIEKVSLKKYNKILVMRSLEAINGQDLGYFPGEKEEKIRPWMQPIIDNLEFLLGRNYENNIKLDIEFDVISYMRGRSIPKQYIIVDDAQNLSPKNIKTILTRIGKHSKIVFTGDPNPNQIDNPYLDAYSNGITYVVQNTKEWDISGHITLKRGERSRIAELASTLK